MSDMGEIFRDWKDFWKERRDINEKEALQYFEEIQKYATLLRYDRDQRTVLLEFRGKKLHYYLARGRWYLAGTPHAIDGGIKAFIGWLKNNSEEVTLLPPQTLPPQGVVETHAETRERLGWTKHTDNEGPSSNEGLNETGIGRPPGEAGGTLHPSMSRPLKVKILGKNRAITVGPGSPLYDKEDPFNDI